MTGAEAATAYAALYGPTSDELLQRVPDIADGLGTRLHELALSPDPEKADQIVRDASGLTMFAMKLATTLRRERDGGRFECANRDLHLRFGHHASDLWAGLMERTNFVRSLDAMQRAEFQLLDCCR